MITWTDCYCLLHGPLFSPRAFEERFGLRFNEAIEPGECGKTGRYKGVPQPFGSAIIFLRCDKDQLADDQAVTDLARARPYLEGIGGTMTVTMDFGYKEQCNIELSPQSVASLAKLACPVGISCFIHTDSTGKDEA